MARRHFATGARASKVCAMCGEAGGVRHACSCAARLGVFGRAAGEASGAAQAGSAWLLLFFRTSIGLTCLRTLVVSERPGDAARVAGLLDDDGDDVDAPRSRRLRGVVERPADGADAAFGWEAAAPDCTICCSLSIRDVRLAIVWRSTLISLSFCCTVSSSFLTRASRSRSAMSVLRSG